MAAASAIAMRHAAAAEQTAQAMQDLAERLGRIEERTAAPGDLGAAELVVAEPLATAAQVAELATRLDAVQAILREIATIQSRQSQQQSKR